MTKCFFALLLVPLFVGCTHSRYPSSTGDVGSVNIAQNDSARAGRSTPEKMDSKNFLCGMDAARIIYADREMDDLHIIATTPPETDDASNGPNGEMRWVVWATNRAGTVKKTMIMVFQQPKDRGALCALKSKSVDLVP